MLFLASNFGILFFPIFSPTLQLTNWTTSDTRIGFTKHRNIRNEGDPGLSFDKIDKTFLFQVNSPRIAVTRVFLQSFAILIRKKPCLFNEDCHSWRQNMFAPRIKGRCLSRTNKSSSSFFPSFAQRSIGHLSRLYSSFLFNSFFTFFRRKHFRISKTRHVTKAIFGYYTRIWQ